MASPAFLLLHSLSSAATLAFGKRFCVLSCTLKLDMVLPDSPAPSRFSSIWEYQTPQKEFSRVYNSKRRNNYCLEYDEYKRVVSNIQMMFPNSPAGQLEFDDWVNMRLEKVENESKALQLKIDAATTKTIGKGHGGSIETSPIMQHPAVHRKTDASQKITKNSLLPAIDFDKDRPCIASLSSSRKYHDQRAGIGPQVTGDNRGGPSLVALSKTSLKSGEVFPHQWEKCRDLWDGVGYGATRKNYDNHGLVLPSSPCSSVPTLSETPSTIGSPVASLPSSPIHSRWSSEANTPPHFDYVLDWPATETQPINDGHVPIATDCGVGLGLEFTNLDGDPDLSWITEDELSDDEEFFSSKYIWCGS